VTERMHWNEVSLGDDDDITSDGELEDIEMIELAHDHQQDRSYSLNDSQSSFSKERLTTVIGPIVSDDADNKVYESVSFGPEQTAVYGREFAQAASPCCPNLLCEGRVERANLKTLLDMEEEAAIQLHQAICELQDARCHVSAIAKDVNLSPINNAISPLNGKKYKTLASKDSSLSESRWDDSSTHMDADLLQSSNRSVKQRSKSMWGQVEQVVADARECEGMNPRTLATGVWQRPSLEGLAFHCLRDWRKRIQVTDAVELARESTFAVVTFTSRQAVVAARNCLADGRAYGRWTTLQEIPIPPLSDAAPCNVVLCRNCCRPVTLNINDRQKACRFYM
jgi:hypothetical protein